MGARTSRVRTVVSAVFTELRAENVTFMAGSIAYHAFVSLLPLLVLLLSAASLLGNRSIEAAIFAVARAMLSRGAGDALIRELQRSTGSAGLSLLGGVVLLWGTLRIFRGLDTAFSDIYETEAANGFLDQVLDGVVVLVAVALAIVGGGFLQDLGRTGDPGLDWVLGGVGATLGIALAFLPMYYVFPDTDVTLLEVLPGTAFAAVGLATFESLFGLYLKLGGSAEEGGIVTGVVVLLTWLYFSGLVILAGVVINAVFANRSRDVNIQPVVGDRSAAAGATPVTAGREELAADVDTLASMLADGEEVTAAVGDRELTMHTPTHAIADTATPSILVRGRPVRLELQWTPAPESAREGENADEDAAPSGAGDATPSGAGDARQAEPEAEVTED